MRKQGSENIEFAELLKSGPSYFDKLSWIIDHAKDVLHVQTFIFENDNTGSVIIEKLCQAANRGVKVYLLVDAYGSRNLSDSLISELVTQGIFFRKFSPSANVFRIFLGKRLHHKVIVADKVNGLIGGINIADRYSGFDNKLPWLDYAIYFRGKAVARAHRICERLFSKKHQLNTVSLKNKINTLFHYHLHDQVTVAFNDWYRQRYEISRSYRHALRKSQNEVILLASYFMPGLRIQRLLKKAAARGVKIRILLPSSSDVGLLYYSTRYLYRWLLKNKIEVYEYKPGMLHAKCALIDDHFLTVGSYNLIALSEYGSVEMNVNLTDRLIIAKAREEFISVIQENGVTVTVTDLPVLNIFRTALDWLAFQFVRTGIRLYLLLSSDLES